MIKNIIKKIIFATIFIVVGFMVYDTYIKLDVNQVNKGLSEDTHKNYVVADAFEDSIENNVCYSGEISIENMDEFYVDICLYYDKDYEDCGIQLHKGDKLEKGDVIGKSFEDGKYIEMTFNHEGVIDDITVDNEEKIIVIRVLDYNSLYYTAYIQKDDLKNINYNTKAYYLNSKSKKVDCYIDHINTFIEEGDVVEVRVKTDEVKEVLPGTKRTIYFVLGNTQKALLLIDEMVYGDDNGHYVYVKTDDEKYIKREIEVGRLIEVVEEGEKIHYYEILDGLSDGEEVYREITSKVNDTAENLLDEE